MKILSDFFNTERMKIEIWSDVMCPFCYIGKRNLETALAQFPARDQIQIEWKSYQLDPTMPENVQDSYTGYLSKKRNVSEAQGNEMLASVTISAQQVGLDYHFDKSIMTNSFKAHVLIQFAKSKNKGDQMEERLFKAFFTNGENISDVTTLIRLGVEIGLEESELAEAFTSDIFAYAVKSDIQEAQNIGVTGVPFFVFDRKYAVSGAQPTEAFLETLTKSFNEWRKNNPETKLEITEGNSCSIDGKCD